MPTDHPSRRDFVAASAASAAAAAWSVGAPAAPRVTAVATPFQSHPDGATVLVRFAATGVDAPAGRLRVYDGGRRLLGTAGMLNTGTELLGELWMPLPRTTTVRSELEAPGVRGVHRTTHRLVPPPRWTAYWLAVVDGAALDAHLDALDPLARTVRAGLLREAGLAVNPLAATADRARDHVAFLQQARIAAHVQRTLGIPVSPLAWSADGVPPVRVLGALVGSGVTAVAYPAAAPAAQIVPLGMAGQILAVGVPAAATADGTRIETQIGAMEMGLGGWLLARSAEPGSSERVVMLVSDDVEAVVQARANVEEWNRRYAYPRIVVGAPAPQHFPSAPVIAAPAPSPSAIPGADARAAARSADETRAAEHSDRLFAALARLVGDADAPAAAVAGAIGSAVPGTVVFNPTPYLRTEALVDADGRLRMATDVPPLGYAYLPDLRDAPSVPAPEAIAAPFTARAGDTTVRLDDETGAVASVIDPDGTEWVHDGLNAVAGAVLTRVARQDLPGVGVRLHIDRRLPNGSPFRSVVTVHAGRRWIDVENTFADDAPAPDITFRFAAVPTRAAWEVPGGVEERDVPVAGADHLRWVFLRGAQNVFLRAEGAPWFSIGADGTFTSHAPPGRARYRVAADTLPATATDAARVGWSTEPLRVVHASGGDGPLPRWGSLMELDQAGAAIVGVADGDADGVTIFVQELSGTGRTLTLAGGLLRFRTAEVVDFTGRVVPSAAAPVPGGVSFPIRGRGFTAVRLGGLHLPEG
jgi:hypothetical protein